MRTQDSSNNIKWELRFNYELFDPIQEDYNSHHAPSFIDKPVGVMIELCYPMAYEEDIYKYDKEVQDASRELVGKYPDIMAQNEFEHDNLESKENNKRYIRLPFKFMPSEDTLKNILQDFITFVSEQNGCQDVLECEPEEVIKNCNQEVKALGLPIIPKTETSFPMLFKEYFLETNPRRINTDTGRYIDLSEKDLQEYIQEFCKKFREEGEREEKQQQQSNLNFNIISEEGKIEEEQFRKIKFNINEMGPPDKRFGNIPLDLYKQEDATRNKGDKEISNKNAIAR